MSLPELQQLFLPAAIGSCAVVYSTIQGMIQMGKVR